MSRTSEGGIADIGLPCEVPEASDPRAVEAGELHAELFGEKFARRVAPIVASVPGGRPTKLKPEILEIVCACIRRGHTVKDAIAAVGVDESSFHRWIRSGLERPGSIYGQFYQSVARAKAEAASVHVEVVYRAGQERSQTVTVTTRRVLQADGQLAVVEETVKVVDRPADVRAAMWMVDRYGAYRSSIPLEGPRDLVARTLAERLRIVQGGNPDDRTATMLRPGDVEARRLLESG